VITSRPRQAEVVRGKAPPTSRFLTYSRSVTTPQAVSSSVEARGVDVERSTDSASRPFDLEDDSRARFRKTTKVMVVEECMNRAASFC